MNGLKKNVPVCKMGSQILPGLCSGHLHGESDARMDVKDLWKLHRQGRSLPLLLGYAGLMSKPHSLLSQIQKLKSGVKVTCPAGQRLDSSQTLPSLRPVNVHPPPRAATRPRRPDQLTLGRGAGPDGQSSGPAPDPLGLTGQAASRCEKPVPLTHVPS